MSEETKKTAEAPEQEAKAGTFVSFYPFPCFKKYIITIYLIVKCMKSSAITFLGCQI